MEQVKPIYKEAAFKLPKLKKLSTGQKVSLGIGAAGTAIQMGDAVKDSAKSLMAPIDKGSVGFQNVKKVIPEGTNKLAYEKENKDNKNEYDRPSLKYLPHATVLAIGGLMALQATQGKNVMTHNLKGVREDALKYAKKTMKPVKIVDSVVKGAKNKADMINKTKTMRQSAYSKYVANANKAGASVMSEVEWAGKHWGADNKLKNMYSKYADKAKSNGEAVKNIKEWKKDNSWRWNKELQDWTPGNSNKEELRDKIKKNVGKATDAGVRGAMFAAGATGANFVGHELGDKYFEQKDKDEVRRRYREDWNKNFADKIVKGQRIDKKYDTGYRTPKQRVDKYKRINKVAGIEGSIPGAIAGHIDDIADGVGKAGKKLKGKALVKDIIKNDVIKGMTTGTAYVAGPALAAKLTGRDRNTFKKVDKSPTNKTVIDIPESMLKKASINPGKMKKLKKIKSDYIMDNVPSEMLRAGVRGISTAVPIAALSNMTNRNFRGNLEKLDKTEKQLKPVDKDTVRITMERRD